MLEKEFHKRMAKVVQLDSDLFPSSVMGLYQQAEDSLMLFSSSEADLNGVHNCNTTAI